MTQPQTSRSRGEKHQPSEAAQAAAQSAHDANEAAAHQSQLARRLADLEAAEIAARAALDEAVSDLGEAAISLDTDKTAPAADLVTERQRDLQRAQAAREALERHLRTAREQEAAAALNAKWDAYAAALDHRHAKFARVDEVAAPFFKAVDEAVAALEEADRLRPVDKILTPNGWVLIASDFNGMANMHRDEMRSLRGVLRDMAAKSRTNGDVALSARAHHTPGETQVTQYDDPRAKNTDHILITEA